MVTDSIKLTDVKTYLGIDYADDDILLTSLLIPASEDMILSHITEDESYLPFFINNPTYNLAVMLMCGHFYENRSATSTFVKHDLPFGVDYAIKKLRMGCYLWTVGV